MTPRDLNDQTGFMIVNHFPAKFTQCSTLFIGPGRMKKIKFLGKYQKIINFIFTKQKLDINKAENLRLEFIINHFFFSHPQFRSDTLAHQSQKLVYAGSGETVSDWLISLGLPMYTDVFISQGWDTLEIVIAMEEDDLRKCGISNPKHLRRLMTAVEHLKMSWRT